MSNLSNEIVRLSKVLEKQIPKGYHELVIEYVRQNVVGAIYDLITIFLCLIIGYFIVKEVFKSYRNKETSLFFEPIRFNGTSYVLNTIGDVALGVAIIVGIIITILFLCSFINVLTSIQHAVAPNYYLIKSVIK